MRGWPALAWLTALAVVGCGGRAHDDAVKQSDPVPNDLPGSHPEPPMTQPGSFGGASPGSSGGSGTSNLGVAGNAIGSDGCPSTFWGGTLEGVPGVRSCEQASNDAILAYGMTQHGSCTKLVGPLGERQAGESISCHYQVDYRDCPNDDSVADYWQDIPVFGSEGDLVSVPQQISFTGCLEALGPVAATSPTALDNAERLIGVWLSCDPPGGPLPGNAVVFDRDGTFRTLSVEPEVKVSDALGCDRNGLWGFLSGTNQLNLYVNAGTSSWAVVFDEGQPPGMTLNGAVTRRYVLAETAD